MSLYLAAQAAAVAPTTVTTGRLLGSVAALVALAGVVAGGLALARNGSRRRGAAVALGAGTVGVVVGGLVVATAKGGPGTGYGIVGGYVALAIGLIALALGGLALTRPGQRV